MRILKWFKKNYLILIIFPVIIFTMLIIRAEAAEQFVGVGSSFDTTEIANTSFNISFGYEVVENQFLATTMRKNPNFSETTADYVNRVVVIEPLGLELLAIGSVGATSGGGNAKFDFGGGIAGLKYLDFLNEKFKDVGLLVGAKFMRNNFNNEDLSGGLNRVFFLIMYRWGE